MRCKSSELPAPQELPLSYNSDFQKDFIERSLLLIQQYNGQYDATVLMNCLLGLVIVPHERCFFELPCDPISDFEIKWGIPSSSIIGQGNYCQSKKYNPDGLQYSFRFFVHDLRISIAHFKIQPVPESGPVQSFRFCNDHGFVSEIPLENLREFVTKFANLLKTM